VEWAISEEVKPSPGEGLMGGEELVSMIIVVGTSSGLTMRFIRWCMARCEELVLSWL
jgi:hypothetical protein